MNSACRFCQKRFGSWYYRDKHELHCEQRPPNWTFFDRTVRDKMMPIELRAKVQRERKNTRQLRKLPPEERLTERKQTHFPDRQLPPTLPHRLCPHCGMKTLVPYDPREWYCISCKVRFPNGV